MPGSVTSRATPGPARQARPSAPSAPACRRKAPEAQRVLVGGQLPGLVRFQELVPAGQQEPAIAGLHVHEAGERLARRPDHQQAVADASAACWLPAVVRYAALVRIISTTSTRPKLPRSLVRSERSRAAQHRGRWELALGSAPVAVHRDEDRGRPSDRIVGREPDHLGDRRELAGIIRAVGGA